MGEILGVSEKTISNRVKELEARDWVIVIERNVNANTGNYQSNFYHVFERQKDAREFRAGYKPLAGERLRAKPAASRKRKSRKGVGGNPTLPRQNSGSDGDQRNSSSDHRPNSSSDNTDSVDPESLYNAPARKQFKVFIPENLALKVDVLTFPAAVNAIFYAYFDVLADPRINRVPAVMMDVLWEQLREDAMGIASRGFTPEQVTAFVLDAYTAPGQDFWKNIDAAMPLKTVAKNLPGYVTRKAKQGAKAAAVTEKTANTSPTKLEQYTQEAYDALPATAPDWYLPNNDTREFNWQRAGRHGRARQDAERRLEGEKTK